jgi:hypothetical protein
LLLLQKIMKKYFRLIGLLVFSSIVLLLKGRPDLSATLVAPTPAPPIHLVWIAPKNQFWEKDWLVDVCRQLQRPILVSFTEPEQAQCPSAGITIIVARWASLLDRLPPSFQNGSCQYAILHPSDEALAESPAPHYGRPGVSFVLRQYALAPGEVDTRRIKTIGLGYKLGFWRGYRGPPPGRITASQRDLLWSFAGTLHHGERTAAVEAFEGLEPHRIDTSSAFDAPDGLSTSAYRAILLRSVFVLCPLGHVNLDTFRLYEALVSSNATWLL